MLSAPVTAALLGSAFPRPDLDRQVAPHDPGAGRIPGDNPMPCKRPFALLDVPLGYNPPNVRGTPFQSDLGCSNPCSLGLVVHAQGPRAQKVAASRHCRAVHRASHAHRDSVARHFRQRRSAGLSQPSRSGARRGKERSLSFVPPGASSRAGDIGGRAVLFQALLPARPGVAYAAGSAAKPAERADANPLVQTPARRLTVAISALCSPFNNHNRTCATTGYVP